MITALTINYNTPELLESLLSSFRQFYDIPYMVVDGSDPTHFEKIKNFPEKYNIELYGFGYNIHHGPGIAYGFQKIKTEQALIIDSDIRILKGGFVEDLQRKLLPSNYGIGAMGIVNRDGINSKIGTKYLHPSLALINLDVARKFLMPIKHGAPMISTMQDIESKGLNILQHESWIGEDLEHSYYDKAHPLNRHYIVHEWNGTVSRTGGIHL